MGQLSGIRVLDLSRVLSGPFCTALLADLGAEVIKIESPGAGDDSRHFGPFVDGASVYFSLINRNKKSVTLNLKHERARKLVRDLAAKSDVAVENFRPGVAARLGIDFASLTEANERIVYLSISGFGQSGANAGWPAYDLIIQAMSGVMSTTGQPEGPPTALGESLADLWTGLFGSWAVLAALHARERTGKGTHIDLAMFDALLSMQLTGLSQLFASGQAPGRVGNRHPMTSPVDVYPTRDGFLAAVVPSDAHFARIAGLIGRPELTGDARFRDNTSRRENQQVLRSLIEQWSSRLSTQEAVAQCLAHDIPAGPVWNLKQAAGSDQAHARKLFHAVAHPAFGTIGMIPQPAKFRGDPGTAPCREPGLGEHTHEVLNRLLGIPSDEIEALRADGLL